MLDCFLRSPAIVKCHFDLSRNSKKFSNQRSLILLENTKANQKYQYETKYHD